MRSLFRRAAGWIGADGNPLRRPVDKFECTLRVAFVLGFLIAAPLIAPATAHQARVAGLREVRQEASWRQVDAVLLRSAPPQYYGYGSMMSHWVPGRWRAPSGVTRRGMVPARSGEQAGTKVSIWVDWNGRMTDRQPMTAGMVQVRTVLTGIGSVAALAVALVVLAGSIRILLNRRRMTYWGIEWACFGPRWSARRWPRS
jgi:hypothetical protein